MSTDERLTAAKSKITVNDVNYPWMARKCGYTWEEPMDSLYRDDPKKFFRQVERAQDFLRGLSVFGERLVKTQDATGLRSVLERLVDGYFAKTHLAVALSELGYRVVYHDSNYFDSDFRCNMAARILLKKLQEGT